MEDAMTDFKAWYKRQPVFTRTYLSVCVVVTLMITLKMVNPFNLLYDLIQAFLFSLSLIAPSVLPPHGAPQPRSDRVTPDTRQVRRPTEGGDIAQSE